MNKEAKRVEYLDSIRGLASLFVLFSHTIGAFAWPDAISRICTLPFLIVFFDGKAAVAMFFVLSGFVLSRPYVPSEAPEKQRKIFLPTFYLRRITRIWLPWFFAFCLSIFCQEFCFYRVSSAPPISQWLDQFWHMPLTISDFFRQCVFLQHDSSRQLLNQDWSLGIELKGSFLIPVFLVLVRGKRLPWFMGLAGLFCVFVHTGHYYVSFMLGVLIAQYGKSLSLFWINRKRSVQIGMFLLGLSLYQSYHYIVSYFGETNQALKTGWIGTAVGCSLILLSVLNSSRLQSLLNHKPVVFIGKISHSVYLLQFIVILCLLPPAMHLLNHCGINQLTLLFALSLIFSTGITIALATLSYQFIELPAINLGHFLSKPLQCRFDKSSR